MTDHHRWDPEEEEIVRRALASLREDVDAHPLPEPEVVRAAGSGLRDIASRRRRAVGIVAGVAAAGLVAVGAGVITWNSSEVAPPASSSTFAGTTSSSAQPVATSGDLVVLGAREWSGGLGRDVSSTVTPQDQDGPCLTPDPRSSWEYRVARLGDGGVAARQWVGADAQHPGRPRASVDEAVDSCTDALSLEEVDSGRLGDGRHRLWHATPEDGPDQWWLEVRRGDQVDFVTVIDDGPNHSAEELRRIGLGVLGEVDLAEVPVESSSSSTTPSGWGSPTPRSTSTPSPRSTEPDEPPVLADPPTSSSRPSSSSASSPSSPSSTSEDEPEATQRPTPAPSAAAEPEPRETGSSTEDPDEGGHPQVGGVAASNYVPAKRWASPALTGGEPSFQGPVEMEGRSYLSMCTSADSGDRIGAIGIRSGEGDMNYFGRQYVLLTDDASDHYAELLEGLASGCTGTGATDLGNGVYKVGDGDFVEYLGVARIGSGVTILHLTEAQTAPGPLTDDVARTELGRLLGLAVTH